MAASWRRAHDRARRTSRSASATHVCSKDVSVAYRRRHASPRWSAPPAAARARCCAAINLLEIPTSGTVRIGEETLSFPPGRQDRSDGNPAPAPPDRHGVPELPALSASDGDRERHGRAGDGAEMAARKGPRDAGAGAAREGRHGPQGRCLAGDAVRRPAAARGDRPRAGPLAARAALRRADLRARSGTRRGGRRRAGRSSRAKARRW